MLANRRAVLGAIVLAVATAVPAPQAYDVCVAGQAVTQVYVTTTVVEYPIYINTFIAYNQNFVVNNDITINIVNAPTQLITNLIGSSTVIQTSTVTNTATVTATATK